MSEQAGGHSPGLRGFPQDQEAFVDVDTVVMLLFSTGTLVMTGMTTSTLAETALGLRDA